MDPQTQKPGSAWLSKAFGSFKGRKDTEIRQTAPDAPVMSPFLDSAIPYHGKMSAYSPATHTIIGTTSSMNGQNSTLQGSQMRRNDTNELLRATSSSEYNGQISPSATVTGTGAAPATTNARLPLSPWHVEEHESKRRLSLNHQPLAASKPFERSISLSSTPTTYPSSMAEDRAESPKAGDDIKLSIAIDFGTTFSGVAYRSARIASGNVQQILHWPGSGETFRKIPTCILYDEYGKVLAWGLEAKNASSIPGTFKCEWFKLYLEPKILRSGLDSDPRLPRLPPGKEPADLIADFLTCLWEYSKRKITKDIGAVADLNSADVWLTVPAAWDAKGCSIMREAAINAGLVRNVKANDKWKERLRIVPEPEAAAVHCAHLTQLHKLRASQHFIICDGGGGTVDLASYRVVGQTQDLEIAEVCSRSGATCGSVFLDLRFRELIRNLLADHPIHLDNVSLAYFMHNFSERDKLMYEGESQDDEFFYFTCFNAEDTDDPSVGLANGELAIPGSLLRKEVFDPVVNDVLQLIEDQLRRTVQVVDALMLVGGFSGSEYLFNRVKEAFGLRIKVIARPWDADTATLRGAAQYGLARRPLVSCVVAPRAYTMRVKLPAEQIDFIRRPQFISNNQAGILICENRVKYLVRKGAIIPRGQTIQARFCKYSTDVSDRFFVATIYTSEVDMEMRYTDEGEILEMCKWTIDLGSLPPFQRLRKPGKGFYTEFDVGLEIDSAEVRGVILYKGVEVGRIVFDFLS